MNITDDYIINNSKICIDDIMFYNTLMKLAIDSSNYIIKYSNDHFYLIKPCNNSFYYKIELLYNKIVKSTGIYIDNTVIDFTTIFSSGTAHGYVGIFNIIDNYLSYYKNAYILIYKNSQQGILDIIYYIINKISNIDKIIYIEPNLVYKFKKIIFIENKYHDFDLEASNKFQYIIDNHIINNKFNKIYNNICIIKSNKSNNITTNGIISYDIINNYCINNRLKFIEPTDNNEIELINIIYNCRILVVSWGTPFFKNYHYLSNKCIYIKVLIYDDVYLYEYNLHKENNSLIYKYKNAHIDYIVIDNIDNYLNKN